MTIVILKGRAVVSTLMMAIALLVMGALSPVLPRAHSDSASFDAQVAGTLALDNKYACDQIEANPHLHPNALYSNVRAFERKSWSNNATPSDEEVSMYIAVSITAFCPENLYWSPPLGGVNIPGNGWATNELVSNYRQLACNLMASSGVDAAVNELAIPKIVYPIGIDEARKAVLISAMILCPNQLGAVHAYLDA